MYFLGATLSPLSCSSAPNGLGSRPIGERQGKSALTQLVAQFASKPFPSTAHSFAAFSLSLMLSTISCVSRHWKYMSRASQHFARSLRPGAIGVPSVDIFGAGGEVEEELENQPIPYYTTRPAGNEIIGRRLPMTGALWQLEGSMKGSWNFC